MKKSFLIHIDSLCILDDLSNDQRGELFFAIYQYQLGIEINLNPLIKIAFSQFKNQFNRDNEKYEKTCEARKLAGSKGGKQRIANQANATNSKQKEANQADKKNKKDNDKENDTNFESLWKWYRDNTEKPIGSKPKAKANYLKQLEVIAIDTLKKGIFNYVKECKTHKSFTKHLVTLLNEDLEDYANRKTEKPKIKQEQGLI